MRTIRITLREDGDSKIAVSKREKQNVSLTFLIKKGNAVVEIGKRVWFKDLPEGGTDA